MIRFTVNGERVETNVAPDTPPCCGSSRDNLQLTGTKYGCGMALCGACTVHVNGEPTRLFHADFPRWRASAIQTIEEVPVKHRSVSASSRRGSEDVVQCGYRQSGQIMAATALLAKTPIPPTPISTTR